MKKNRKSFVSAMLAGIVAVFALDMSAFTVNAEAVTASNVKVKGYDDETAQLKMELYARYNSGNMSPDGGSMEIVEYNSVNGYAYAVSGKDAAIVSIKVKGVSNGATVTELTGNKLDVKTLVESATGEIEGFIYGDTTSVAISPDGKKLAASIQHKKYDEAGVVAVFDCNADGSISNPKLYVTGVQPDMVTFAGDNIILTADEGEPRNGYGDGTVDPAGTVFVIDISKATSTQVGFGSFTAEELIAKNIIVGKVDGVELTPELDMEPEYIAVESDGKTAYVALQEANAIAVLNLSSTEPDFTGIYSVGYEDYSQVKVDISKKDGAYLPSTYDNVVGARMPDGISIYENNGNVYLLTANEGDSREWGEEGTANYYCNEKEDKNIANGKVVLLDGDKCAGLPENKKVLYGGRSFTIFKVTESGLAEVFDSADDFERITADKVAEYFNCSNDSNEIDDRSGKKGPEPENITIGTIGDRTYAFIAIERVSGIMVYDITNPAEAEYVNYINSRDFSEEIKGDVSPEGICFLKDNGNGKPAVIASCEVSGTVAVYELTGKITESEDNEAENNNTENNNTGNNNITNNTTEESTFTKELTEDSQVVSSTEFAAILTENATKDVTIKNNDGVIFKFAKGTMNSVEGKTGYDFGTSITAEYSKVTGLSTAVTKDNFVLQLDYNYLGKLPAKATITLNVGSEYAGKTLYYYLCKSDKTYELVQSAVVDNSGVVSITQDHCSTYIFTSEKLAETTENPSTSERVPDTGDETNAWMYIVLLAAAMGVVLTISKTRKKSDSDLM